MATSATLTASPSVGLTDMSAEHYGVVAQRVADDLHELRASLMETAGTLSHAQEYQDDKRLVDLTTGIEDRITKILQTVDPGTPVVGEERDPRSERRYWLIDPIDGLMHFMRGNPYYCFTLVLIADDEPQMSVVYDFAGDKLYYAIRGHGAYCNGKRLKVSARPISDTVMATEIDLTQTHNILLQQELAAHYRLLNLFASNYELAMVASGRTEARMCIDALGLHCAPGVLLVQEAGGVARNLAAADYRTNDSDVIVASTPELYDQLRRLAVASR